MNDEHDMDDRQIHHEAEPDEPPGPEREALRNLPREMIPPAHLEERVTRALRHEGLLQVGAADAHGRAAPPRRLRLTRATGIAAAAAALALFVSGVAVGQWTATRAVADGVLRARAEDPAAQAAEVQQAGSDYVRAVAGLADLAAKGDEKAVAPGREAATVALHAAALELARMSPGDPTLRLVLAVLEDRLRSPGKPDGTGVHNTFWF